jgi:hypothetical protein
LDAIDIPTFRPLIAGFLYGTLLLVVAIVIGGGGHGLTLFFVLSGAPITIGGYLLPMRMPTSLRLFSHFRSRYSGHLSHSHQLCGADGYFWV